MTRAQHRSTTSHRWDRDVSREGSVAPLRNGVRPSCRQRLKARTDVPTHHPRNSPLDLG